ncbi:hypothetical protein OJ996_10685 [Luteolibacter sp. GHJ8]|jgi:hypothetical protein|uniref:Uncharacterized protein n=1 Tax=Luteolibacter rhizosphaerae TaxID=2989719 RepID=A0ABT3G2I6_9BACT|nr:hypothetical protein [Luteolibacter rhizosphaerae]MCW1914043.1 hypothetical protein [Luteolibacter rhizosphaerae]
MDSEFQDLENALKGLRPASPDDACMSRLLAAVEGRLQKPEMSASGIESRLAAMQPVAPSPQAFEKMLETVSRVPFPVSDKVVLFPGAPKAAKERAASRRPWYAAAAAVAVAGAFSAMMVDKTPTNAVVSNPQPKEFAPVPKMAGNANPNGIVSASRGLQGATDQGVRWTPDGKPMRMVQVEYKDRVKVLDKDGKPVEVEVPRFEYLFVPEKID